MSAGRKLAIALVWLVVLAGGALVVRYVVFPQGFGKPPEELEAQFLAAWEKALDEGTDSPDVEEYAKKASLSKRAEMRERLKQLDEDKRHKHPRLNLALDAFSGYCVFRSPAFLKRLADDGILLHLADDKADYKKRITTLQSGETPLAVFTIDALINNSASLSEPPATIVMIIDESRGADAVVGYDKDFKTEKDPAAYFAALNQPNVKYVLTTDSPSETLARVVRIQHKGPALPSDYLVPADGAKDVLEKFKAHAKAKPGEAPKAFVLWEPFVSQALKEAESAKVGAHILADSANPAFDGCIVDILVVQRDYLQKNRAQVQKIVEAYFQTLASFDTKGKKVQLVMDDAKKTGDVLYKGDAERLVEKITWKGLQENYAHFGIEGQGLQPVEDMIKKLTAVLTKSHAISRDPTGGKPERLYDDGVLRELKATAGLNSAPAPAAAALSDDEWQKLQPVSNISVEPIEFGRGSSAVPESSRGPEQVADVLRQWPSYYLEVRGHVLARAGGDPEMNRKLAEDRAASVSRKLQALGISGHRIRAFGSVDQADAEQMPQVTFRLLRQP
jgi:outer membrane protein OmpA-like peptidoglycan-associated protein